MCIHEHTQSLLKALKRCRNMLTSDIENLLIIWTACNVCLTEIWCGCYENVGGFE